MFAGAGEPLDKETSDEDLLDAGDTPSIFNIGCEVAEVAGFFSLCVPMMTSVVNCKNFFSLLYLSVLMNPDLSF